jgi:hypothetical protein
LACSPGEAEKRDRFSEKSVTGCRRMGEDVLWGDACDETARALHREAFRCVLDIDCAPGREVAMDQRVHDDLTDGTAPSPTARTPRSSGAFAISHGDRQKGRARAARLALACGGKDGG